MLRSYPRPWDLSSRHPWAKRGEPISLHTYLLCALVVIAISTAVAGGKQPMASFLLRPSIDRVLASPLNIASMLAVLQAIFLVVLLILAARVGRTIEAQHRALEEAGARISQLVEQNEKLRQRLSAAYVRSVERHDAFSHGLGLALRGQPAQLVEDALRELESLTPEGDLNLSRAGYVRIRTALEDSLTAIRKVSSDLAVAEVARLPSAS